MPTLSKMHGTVQAAWIWRWKAGEENVVQWRNNLPYKSDAIRLIGLQYFFIPHACDAAEQQQRQEPMSR